MQNKIDYPKIELEHQIKMMKSLHDHAGSPEARHMFNQILDSLYRLHYLENKLKKK